LSAKTIPAMYQIYFNRYNTEQFLNLAKIKDGKHLVSQGKEIFNISNSFVSFMSLALN
jgi:hypothetical protein